MRATKMAELTISMNSQMLVQMVRASKTLFADRARERLDTRMRAKVAGKLVGAGKSPRTIGPRALKRFVTGVASHVRAKMRALGICFHTSLPRTGIDGLAIGARDEWILSCVFGASSATLGGWSRFAALALV